MNFVIQKLPRFSIQCFHDGVEGIFANFTKQLSPYVRVDLWRFSLLLLAIEPLLQAGKTDPLDPASARTRIYQLV
jgi:hypothetical protein